MNSRRLKKISSRLKAASDSTRIKILSLLSGRNLCVCELTSLLGVSQPTVSRHLARLEDAGFVRSTRRGSWMIYKIEPEDELAGNILALLFDAVTGDET